MATSAQPTDGNISINVIPASSPSTRSPHRRVAIGVVHRPTSSLRRRGSGNKLGKLVHQTVRLGYDIDLELGPVLHLGDSEVRVGTCSWTDKTLIQGATLVPEEDDDRGRAARVLRRAVLGGRGRQHVLPAAVAGAHRRLGRAHARRLPHEREGVLADDGPSHQAGGVVGRHPRGDRAGSGGQGQRLPEAPARRRARRGVVPVRRRAEAVAREREARRGAAAVPAVVHAEARQPRRARAGAQAAR